MQFPEYSLEGVDSGDKFVANSVSTDVICKQISQ